MVYIVYLNHPSYMLWEKYELNKIGIPSSGTLMPGMFEVASFSNSRPEILSKGLCENIRISVNIVLKNINYRWLALNID